MPISDRIRVEKGKSPISIRTIEKLDKNHSIFCHLMPHFDQEADGEIV